MRALFFIAVLCGSLIGFAGSGFAMAVPGSKTPALASQSQPSRSDRLNQLFAKLKRESDPNVARQTAVAIEAIWQDSGSPTIDLLMKWTEKAITDKHYGTALDLLDQVTMLEPEYAEGWNRRATVHFLMSDYDKSMADIDRVLALEPRHFGALSGMAAIFKVIGKDRLAMKALERVLAIYPADREAQDHLGALAEELAGESI
jgi:tetratricopeptide (TPR) repeat protein